MAKNIFGQACKLNDVNGRLKYTNAIDDKEKKKNEFLGSYDTTSNSTAVNFEYWNSLAEYNQEQFRNSSNYQRTYIDKNGVEHECQCCEAREFIIEIPNEYYYRNKNTNYDNLAKSIAKLYKKLFGCECNVAIHMNADKTNLHAHIIFSEREYLLEKKTASRNLFFDENGKRRYKKSEILNEDKTLREGCRIVKKGTVLEEYTFTSKNTYLKSNAFTKKNKEAFAKQWNKLLKEDKYQVFDNSDIYLAQKKIKKEYKKEVKERIKEENKSIAEYNDSARQLVESGYDRAKLIEEKKKILEKQTTDTSTEYHFSFIERLQQAINRLKETLIEWIQSIKEKEKEEIKVLDDERKDEILKIDEHYNTLPEEEYDSDEHQNWLDSLTKEEREFLEQENEKYESFLDREINSVKTHKNTDSRGLEQIKVNTPKRRSNDFER